MRRMLVFFWLVLLTLPAFNQESTGKIYGKVVDEDNVALPGVSITLTGAMTAPVSVISGANGDFRFLNLFPARDYCNTTAIESFNRRCFSVYN